ncbi:hypothetical protein [Candidatus Korobacter versatilis]|nr:hypothetical protein [Candidatus Koribacter versatilis]
MRDLHDATLIKLKAGLFLLLGVLASGLLLADRPAWRRLALLSITVWAFCRLYYFAFYVIERYLDPTYRFSGLISAVRYLAKRRATLGR